MENGNEAKKRLERATFLAVFENGTHIYKFESYCEKMLLEKGRNED